MVDVRGQSCWVLYHAVSNVLSQGKGNQSLNKVLSAKNTLIIFTSLSCRLEGQPVQLDACHLPLNQAFQSYDEKLMIEDGAECDCFSLKNIHFRLELYLCAFIGYEQSLIYLFVG